MDLGKIRFTNLLAFNNGKYPALVEVSPIWEYLDGRPSDKRVGTAYTVLLSGHRYEEAIIKTDEVKEAITNDFIEEHGGMVLINAKQFVGRIFQYIPKGKAEDGAPSKPVTTFSLKAKTVFAVDETGNMVSIPNELIFT